MNEGKGWSVAVSPARRSRLILIVALLLLACGMLYVARAALFPYALGLVAAYLLLPAVNFVDRYIPDRLRQRNLSRLLAVVLVYLAAILVIAAFVAFLVPVVADQFAFFRQRLPYYTRQGHELIEEWFGKYQATIPLNIQQTVQDNLEKLAGTIGRALQQGITRTLSVVSTTISFLLGMMVIPFWLFYILHDQKRVSDGLFSLVPERYRADVSNVLHITDDILSAYIRGQLLLCLVIGAMATIGLFIVGVDFALLLGIVAGLFEFLPFIGPILGAIPALVVALIQSPTTALWTLVVFLFIQQVENIFLAPRIAGESVKLHPALVMVVLVVGNEALGIWGMLIAVPFTAIVRDVFKYLYLRFSDEEVPPPAAMARVRTEKMVIDV